jgi:hypothetical protein
VREQCDDTGVVIVADRGWGRVGVKARAHTHSRRGNGIAIVITVFVIDKGVGPWGCPVGAPG